MYLSNAEEIRECDRRMIENFALPGIILMENAGEKATQFLLIRFPSSQFLILAGPGNNGGDGLVIARKLWMAGRNVKVILSSAPDNFKGDAKINYDILSKTPVEILLWPEVNKDSPKADTNLVIVDALLGTGNKEALRGSIKEIISFFADANHSVVAIDLPSGLIAGTGNVVSKPLTADVTITFQHPKICHYVTPASEYCGDIIVAGIGIYSSVSDSVGMNRKIITADDFRNHYRPRNQDSHKGTYGHVLMIGGSKNMAGAIALSGAAALKTGSGLVTAFVPGAVRTAFYRFSAEQMCHAWGDENTSCFTKDAVADAEKLLAGKSLVAIGPGIGTAHETAEFLAGIIPKIQVPMIWDADALNLLSQHPEWWKHISGKCILTPHPGEMKRLSGNQMVNEFRLETAETFAKENNCTLVLKGAGTIVATFDSFTWVNSTGNAGMASGGAGDVLTGMIAGLLSCGYSPEQAAVSATYLHGLAGDIAAEKSGMESITAESILSEIGPAFLRSLEGNQVDVKTI